MVRFEDALDVRALDNGRDWQVLEDFYYVTDVTLAGWPAHMKDVSNGRVTKAWGARIEIPKGFVTDFASIPRPLWSIVGGPADGKYRKAAVVHDFLYRTGGVATRYQADQVLLEAMKVCGCSWFQRTVIYSGVRVGGSNSYKGGL